MALAPLYSCLFEAVNTHPKATRKMRDNNWEPTKVKVVRFPVHYSISIEMEKLSISRQQCKSFGLKTYQVATVIQISLRIYATRHFE